MSTPTPPRSAGSGSTRQLLDELDALMERMLALPVNQLDDEPAAPTSTATVLADAAPLRDRPPAPTPPAEQPASRPETVEPPTGKRVIAHAPAPFPPRPHTTEEPPATRPPVKKMPPPDESAVLVPPTPKPTPPPVKVAPVSTSPLRRSPLPGEFAPPAAPKVPLWQRIEVPEWAWRALLWSNRTFDRSTLWLGNSGRWLRSPRGRMVLGWAGLVLWSIALALGILRFLG